MYQTYGSSNSLGYYSVEKIISYIQQINAKNKIWDRRKSGQTVLHNTGGSAAFEKDFFSDEPIDDEFIIIVMFALVKFPTLYLMRRPGEVGNGPVYYLMHYLGKGADPTILKFRMDDLSDKMKKRVQTFLLSDRNREKAR